MEIINHVSNNNTKKIEINLEDCIGCGVCASNCPEGTIHLSKTNDFIPPKTRPGLLG